MDPLTRDEIRFFKREGYLIKRGVLDPELMARARERKWEGAPARMQKDDPTTWFGPFRPDEEHGEEGRKLPQRIHLEVSGAGARAVDRRHAGHQPGGIRVGGAAPRQARGGDP